MSPAKKPAPGPVLTLDAILAIDDLKTETVEVPEWSGSVVVREFTAGEQLQIADDNADSSILALVYGLKEPAVDEDGARSLLGKSGPVVGRIIDAIVALNAGGEEAVKKAEAAFLAGDAG